MNIEYKNIIDSVQGAIDKICEQKYKDDTECPPKFIVSLYECYENGEFVERLIILTIDHMGIKYSRPIFSMHKYGYESLSETMKNLYNSTM